jgi:hypothetical protein
MQVDPLYARCWSLTLLVLPRGYASGVLLSRRLYLPSVFFVQYRMGIILVQLNNVNYLGFESCVIQLQKLAGYGMEEEENSRVIIRGK